MSKRRQKKTKATYKQLDLLHQTSKSVELDTHKQWVIFSDLHMGDGGSTDDFKRNSQLFISSIEQYYQNHALILNGDIEELQRFPLHKITKSWKKVYNLFQSFNEKGRLYKTVGNHDLTLDLEKNYPFKYDLLDSLRLTKDDDEIFIFHGHQASQTYQSYNKIIGFVLKYFFNPLGIKNYSVSHDSKKQYKIEKRVYGYSSFSKKISIIGHTHRPLFESLNKVERLKFKLEDYCRSYIEADKAERKEIKANLKAIRKELKKYYRNNTDYSYQGYVYDTRFQVPCLFNSGCVVGKRGMTCIEIDHETIRLVHWFDKEISKKYLIDSGYEPEELGDTGFFRMVLNEDSLDYIFTKINFLA